MGSGDTIRLMEAARFAAERHSRQRRKDAETTPYINHLIDVSAMIARYVGDSDPNLVIAGLLHDSIEDVGVTREEIAALFGEDVAELVWLVTDDKSLEKAERKRLQVANAPKKPPRVQMLKLADKISNLRAIRDSPPGEWTVERRREYVRWARAVIGGFTSPDPGMLAEFEAIAAELETLNGV